ncbi:hypothetical protein DD237_004416 [Peronospora effusa]|uniref:Crinkler effector protein N-terminal domain-containing protein n=1 Tax=Peronospora effusa TaxID=542832 RepID=A0A3R7Y8H6_9STRA|nr:hypothetical protein DD237_004416 [Peronospora effusa]
MLTLFCAIVGTKGSVFPVDIDANRSVYDLKKEMKAKKLYHFPSDQFQLFVASDAPPPHPPTQVSPNITPSYSRLLILLSCSCRTLR